jgi:hypothetical protein
MESLQAGEPGKGMDLGGHKNSTELSITKSKNAWLRSIRRSGIFQGSFLHFRVIVMDEPRIHTAFLDLRPILPLLPR